LVNDSLELVLELAGGQLLAVVDGIDHIEFVLAKDDHVVVLDRVENGLIVRGLLGHTAVVEHVLVGIHAHGLSLGHFNREGFATQYQ